MLRCIAVLAVVLWLEAPAFATTYRALTFDEIVTAADLIFVGEVADVRSFPIQTRDATIIKTRVTFSVADPIAGTTSLVEVLEFLGGEWNGVGMEVAGMPRFTVGERRLVFARRGRFINPVVGFTQGVLQVVRDGSGVDRVLTLDGRPLPDGGVVGLSDLRTRVARVRAQVKK